MRKFYEKYAPLDDVSRRNVGEQGMTGIGSTEIHDNLLRILNTATRESHFDYQCNEISLIPYFVKTMKRLLRIMKC